MLTSNELDAMERMVDASGVLLKRDARRLIAAYREVLNSTPHVLDIEAKKVFDADRFPQLQEGKIRRKVKKDETQET